MSNTLKRSLLCLLCLLLALMLSVSCTPEQTGTGTDTSAAEETTASPEESFFRLDKTAYTVISQFNTDSEPLREAISLLGDATEAYFGRSIKNSDDWYRGEMVRYNIEILLGTTNRPESVAAEAGLTYYDYMYEVVSPGVVLICGGSDEATLSATRKFLLDCYGFRSEADPGALCDIPVGTAYTYRHEYAVKQFLLGDKPIDGYTVVHNSDKKSVAAAELLQTELERICGISVPTVKKEDYRGGDAILLGMAKSDGTHLDIDFGSISYAVKQEKSGDDSLLILDSTLSADRIVTSFAAQFLRNAPEEETLRLAFSEKGSIYCGYYTEMANQLRLTDETQNEVIGDGVVYRKLTYADKDGKPVLAFVIEADLSKVSVINATPNNGEAIQNVKATTKQAMQSLTSAGYAVLAGVNADFFRINGDYSPQGLCVKNGKELSDSSSRPWFGITADGTPVIGTHGDYSDTYRGKLVEAVGGSHIFLKNGIYHDVGLQAGAYDTDFSSIRHPRTAVGITEDGRLILLVVDGRTEISNGASMVDLAEIMLSLGATDALNLDGGGSSTMITYANGSYKTRNAPSDGSLRAVYNSLVLVKK